MACQHYNITVTGKVQGVWFRKYTQDTAVKLGLKGFVRNQPDASVYIEVESNDMGKLNLFINWLNEGSPLSKVEQVNINKTDTCNNFDNFVIQR